MNKNKLQTEASRMTEMLSNKTVSHICRHKDTEVLIEFKDGTRLFVDVDGNSLEFSITGDFDE